VLSEVEIAKGSGEALGLRLGSVLHVLERGGAAQHKHVSIGNSFFVSTPSILKKTS
jgi:hypothetical protein